jgi:hypothetical protein
MNDNIMLTRKQTPIENIPEPAGRIRKQKLISVIQNLRGSQADLANCGFVEQMQALSQIVETLQSAISTREDAPPPGASVIARHAAPPPPRDKHREIES